MFIIILDVFEFKVFVGLFVIINFGLFIMVCVIVICCCWLFDSLLGVKLFLLFRFIVLSIVIILFFCFIVFIFVYISGIFIFFKIVLLWISLKFWKINLIVLFFMFVNWLLDCVW